MNTISHEICARFRLLYVLCLLISKYLVSYVNYLFISFKGDNLGWVDCNGSKVTLSNMGEFNCIKPQQSTSHVHNYRDVSYVFTVCIHSMYIYWPNPYRAEFTSQNINTFAFPLISKHWNYTSWWHHRMETFSALLALCAGNSPVPVNSPHKAHDAELWCFLNLRLE